MRRRFLVVSHVGRKARGSRPIPDVRTSLYGRGHSASQVSGWILGTEAYNYP